MGHELILGYALLFASVSLDGSHHKQVMSVLGSTLVAQVPVNSPTGNPPWVSPTAQPVTPNSPTYNPPVGYPQPQPPGRYWVPPPGWPNR